MHEMSIVHSLMEIIKDEMKKHNATRLLRVRVRYGALAGVMPDALSLAFEVYTTKTPFSEAIFETIEEPLCLACGACAHEFSPTTSAAYLLEPCPKCGEDFGHNVLSGKELYLDQLEIE